MKRSSKMEIVEFKKIIWDYYRAAGRSFPWRGADPWGVLVSEFMLQQTQTARVVPYWERWMKRWPAPRFLADAPMDEALREWSGLGYNRRCFYLKNCAALITSEHGGRVPETAEALRLLPGIGDYSSRAIACFAYNAPLVFIETNIRAAAIHFFFSETEVVKDSEILPILETALDRENPREWHYALMDYGAALKKITANPSRRSAHYAKQSPFEGSFRQARGKALRALAQNGPASAAAISESSGLEREVLYHALAALERESLVAEKGGIYRITEKS
jgi:A/G-specific adenine glycosylase